MGSRTTILTYIPNTTICMYSHVNVFKIQFNLSSDAIPPTCFCENGAMKTYVRCAEHTQTESNAESLKNQSQSREDKKMKGAERQCRNLKVKKHQVWELKLNVQCFPYIDLFLPYWLDILYFSVFYFEMGNIACKRDESAALGPKQWYW